jgi:excisionase family DNA binding protein
MSKGLGLQVVAEGVESTAQADAVRALGCPSAQGWLFSRPVGADQLPSILANGLPVLEGASPRDAGATVTLKEAAALLNVSTGTVRRWADAGRLKSVRTRGGHRRLRRGDVEREVARLRPSPMVRAARMPERPLIHAGTAIGKRLDWIAEKSLRAVYVGDDHGWFGTPRGHAAVQQWLSQLAEGFVSGDYGRAKQATRHVLRLARTAGVPLLERSALINAVAQVTRAAIVGAGESTADEIRDLERILTALRRVAVEET